MGTTALTDPITFRNAVRTECGSPAVGEISDETIDQKIILTLDRLRRAVPRSDDRTTFLLSSFTLVNGTQSYAIPEGREIIDIWYTPINPAVYAPLAPVQEFANIPNAIFQPGLYLRSDELIAEIARQQVEDRYHTEILGGMVYFDPIPDGTISTAYYSYRNLTGSVMPSSLNMGTLRALLLGTTAACCRVLGNRAARQMTGIAGQGLIDRNRGPDWARMAGEYEEMFADALMELSIPGGSGG